jgi:hypothetical protein
MYHLLCHERRWGTFLRRIDQNTFEKRRHPVKQLVVKSLSQAMKMVKEMDVVNAEEWSGDCREFGRKMEEDRIKEYGLWIRKHSKPG